MPEVNEVGRKSAVSTLHHLVMDIEGCIDVCLPTMTDEELEVGIILLNTVRNWFEKL